MCWIRRTNALCRNRLSEKGQVGIVCHSTSEQSHKLGKVLVNEQRGGNWQWIYLWVTSVYSWSVIYSNCIITFKPLSGSVQGAQWVYTCKYKYSWTRLNPYSHSTNMHLTSNFYDTHEYYPSVQIHRPQILDIWWVWTINDTTVT